MLLYLSIRLYAYAYDFVVVVVVAGDIAATQTALRYHFGYYCCHRVRVRVRVREREREGESCRCLRANTLYKAIFSFLAFAIYKSLG